MVCMYQHWMVLLLVSFTLICHSPQIRLHTEATTRLFGDWMLINCSFQTAIENLPGNEVNWNSICYSTTIENYPIIILNVDVSSSLNMAFKCVVMTIAGCNMQESLPGPPREQRESFHVRSANKLLVFYSIRSQLINGVGSMLYMSQRVCLH